MIFGERRKSLPEFLSTFDISDDFVCSKDYIESYILCTIVGPLKGVGAHHQLKPIGKWAIQFELLGLNSGCL